MKLKEIPDYLNKKVRRIYWEKEEYIYFNGINWTDKRGNDLSLLNISTNDWEPFEEPKPKKKIFASLFPVTAIAGLVTGYIMVFHDNENDSKRGIRFPSEDIEL